MCVCQFFLDTKILFILASRSCYEMKLLGVSASGTYFIDPDGLQGSPPVQVYCDMKTGK